MSKEETLDDILSDEPKIEEPETPEEDAEEPVKAEEPEQDPEPAEDPSEPPDEPQRVPLAALQEARAKEKEAKGALSEMEKQMAALQAQVQTLMNVQPQPKEEPKPFKLPDPLDDADAYNGSIMELMDQRDRNLRAEMSETFAVRQHGKEAVDEAFQRAKAAGMISNFASQPDPYGALMDWDSKQKSFSAIEQAGGLEAYEKQLRAQWEAERNAEAVADQIAPSAPSLAGETDLGRRSPLQQQPVVESLKDILGNPHDV